MTMMAANFKIMSSAYNSLDPRVRKWVYKQGWSSLRPFAGKLYSGNFSP